MAAARDWQSTLAIAAGQCWWPAGAGAAAPAVASAAAAHALCVGACCEACGVGRAREGHRSLPLPGQMDSLGLRSRHRRMQSW